MYKIGEKTVINGPEIDLEEPDRVYLHTLSCIGNFLVALREDINLKTLGLTKKNNKKVYFQCLDPGEPYINGGTVIFEIT